MFSLLGKIVTRFWPLLLGAWLLGLGVSWRLAPPWDQVTKSGDVSFLPDDASSRRGQQLFKKASPDEYVDSSIVLVLSREDSSGLLEQDRKFIAENLTPTLKKMAAEQESARGASSGPEDSLIARVRAPEDQGVGALLRSRDKRAALV